MNAGPISAALESAAAENAEPSCPVESQIGTATVGVGVGPEPFFVKTARVYLGPLGAVVSGARRPGVGRSL